ncbi:MAG TPA: gamma-glutamyltransferase [Planctomycetaceae bacterium]|jgi:gamma-glutamyltranspeptidase/glutathione hydrolase|nr:gamma-glutamyltransferase [Planctomycetaceae bacterium]
MHRIHEENLGARCARPQPPRYCAIAALIALTLCLSALLCTAAEPRNLQIQHGDLVRCQNGVVVSVHPLASRIGADALVRGGTAVDAAVATAFALAVTWPGAGNIGGGGYMVIVPTLGKAVPVVVDFREVAPAAATKEMFVAKEGRTPHRRVGVPGTVRGLALAHGRFGRLAWRDLVMPAVGLARDGFSLDAATASSLNEYLGKSEKQKFAELHRVFGKPGGGEWKSGDRLVQPELAETLEQIADRGPDAFYLGGTADKLAAEMRRGRGLITKDDLAAYHARFREPVRGTYRGFEIVSVPPSSSGGTTLIEELNILENFDLHAQGRWSAATLHLLSEAAKRAFRDRACYLGDPDRVTIPAKLTQKDYARSLARGIDLHRATPSVQLAGDIPIAQEAAHTTHFSVIDRERTAVSLTYTLENMYGSRVVVPGAGFLLNDEMNDFGWHPGVTDSKGTIGTLPNQIAPGKRMLSSMCPTVVLKDGKPFLITGSPGGRTIINTVLCMLVNVLDFEMDPRAAVDAPRFHHQWFPDRIKVEPRLAREYPALLKQLEAMGHVVRVSKDDQGDAHSIWIDRKTGDLIGVADKRENGCAAGY